MKDKFNDFLIHHARKSKQNAELTRAESFNNLSEASQLEILESIIKMDDLTLLRNISIVADIFECYNPDSRNKEIFGKVIEKVLKRDFEFFYKIPQERIDNLKDYISRAIRDNHLDRERAILAIPEDKLDLFTETIKISMRESYNWDSFQSMVEKIPKEKRINYHDVFKDKVLRSPSMAPKILYLIPENQQVVFVSSTKEIFRTNPEVAIEILSILPRRSISELHDLINLIIKESPRLSSGLIQVLANKGQLAPFTNALSEVLRLNATEHSTNFIGAIVKSEQIEMFKPIISRVMSENPALCSSIISSISKDKLAEFYSTISDVLIDDQKYNNGKFSAGILSSIPEDKKSQLLEILGKKVDKNPIEIAKIIKNIDKKNLHGYIDAIAARTAEKMILEQSSIDESRKTNTLKLLLENSPPQHHALITQKISEHINQGLSKQTEPALPHPSSKHNKSCFTTTAQAPLSFIRKVKSHFNTRT